MKFLNTCLIGFFLTLSSQLFAAEIQDKCVINDDVRKEILDKISSNEKDILPKLDDCYSRDRKLILQASVIDFEQFKNASDTLKQDESFIYNLIKVSPKSLQFASPKLLANPVFMERATYLYRDSLQYCDPKLLDNRFFMQKMINIDSRNYIFASNRIKEDVDLAKMAFSDDGLLIASAPDKIKTNKLLAEIAIQSDNSALSAIPDPLRSNKALLKLISKKETNFNEETAKKFIEDNYIVKEKKKNLGLTIANQAKFSKSHAIINHNYITRWKRNSYFEHGKINEEFQLLPAQSHNYPTLWKEDFKKFPTLIAKIESFLLKHNLDQNTIDNLSTTYFWKVKNSPQTYVFNLYLMRESRVKDLGKGFSNVTSLSAIVQEHKNGWHLTIVEVIFDSELKVDVSFENGHKRYIFWDIYDAQNNPKIIFKVEDSFNNYFEIFAEENGGKYRAISKIEIDLKKDKKN
jgi:hypothetical protein